MGKRCLGAYRGVLLVVLVLFCPGWQGAEASEGSGADSVSVQELERRLQSDPESATLWLRLGYARLRGGDAKGAEVAFKKAEKEQPAKAYNGLGLAYAARPRGFRSAIYFFQMALSKDPKFVEAHYNKALTYFSENWLSHAIRAAREAVAVDSTFAPAQALIIRCRAINSEGEARSKEAYEELLESNPEDLEGWLEWARIVLADGDYEQIRRRLPPVMNAHPAWTDLLPILGQAYWKANLSGPAWAAFSVYLDSLEAEERRWYEDISLVSWGDEAREYQWAYPEEKPEIAKRFWAKRDQDYTTLVNERLLEHHRRVWYARTYFGKQKSPWDARGEVYIRYGEPDHRSRSRGVSPPPGAAVNAVKERFFNMLYSDEYILLAVGGGSEYVTFEEYLDGEGENLGTMKGVQWFDSVTGGLTGSLAGPVFPILSYTPESRGGVYLPVGSTDFSIVPWESWVYTDINGGIVIDFTDQVGKGAFDYAPIPEMGKTPGLKHGSTSGKDAIRAFRGLARLAPLAVIRTAAAAVPERYAIPEEDRPLDFYFDQAQFRGEADSSRVEIYYGVPMSEATYFSTEGKTAFEAACGVALVNREGRGIYRFETRLVYLEAGDRTGDRRVIPHLAGLNITPGEYTLDVRMKNRLNGEIGVYRKHLSVEAYPPGPLKLSDIQLAWKVSEEGQPDRFSKNGLRVVPMPTRLYRKGQPVYIYYEIYNLKRDAFGMTNYTVEYTVRSGEPPGAISRILRVFKGTNEQVSVAQEQLGTQETQPSYLELDLSEVVPGEVALSVRVEDLNSGETGLKEAKFEVREERGAWSVESEE